MSRIRSIHPRLFTDEAFMALTVNAPLAIPLLLGLWTEADDAGTFEWKPLTIKARILPAASADVGDLLRELMAVDVIQHFRLDGKDYGVIRNFVKFQRPKDPKDIYPHSEETRAYAGFTSEGLRPRSGIGRPPAAQSSEPLPKSFGTTSEERCQREEGGGSSNNSLLSTATPTDEPVVCLKTERKKLDTELIQTVVGEWNDLAASLRLPQVVHISDTRQRNVLRRAKELVEVYDYPDAISGFRVLFSKIRGSPFLRGEASQWRADFDFVVTLGSFTKIMEDRYEGSQAKPAYRR